MSLTKVTSKGTTTISDGWTIFNNLIDDLASTSNELGASCIGVEDSAGNFTGATVEAVLAEISDNTAGAVSLYGIFDEDPSTTTGLTWGYTSGNYTFDGTLVTLAAGTISLTDDATNYIEIDPTDDTIKRNTTAFTTGRIPLRVVVAASGAQTSSTDYRTFFTFTSFDGSQFNSAVIVSTGDSGGTANASYDDFVVESSGQSGISVLSPDAQFSNFALGHASNATSFAIQAAYNSGDEWASVVVGGKVVMQFDSTSTSGSVIIGDGNSRGDWPTGYDIFQVGNNQWLYTTSGGNIGLSFNAVYDNTDSRWEYETTDQAAKIEIATSGATWFYNTPSGTGGDPIAFNSSLIDPYGIWGIGGVVPELWNSTHKAVQINTTTAISATTTEGGFSENAYYDDTDNRWEYITTSHASLYTQSAGTHAFKTSASGTADNAITFQTTFQVAHQAVTLNGSYINTINTLADDATPSVANGRVFLTGGTTTITDFDDGVTGQEIVIIAEHAITITDGTNIFLSGSANFVMAATDTLTLICKADNKWYEIARSDNT